MGWEKKKGSMEKYWAKSEDQQGCKQCRDDKNKRERGERWGRHPAGARGTVGSHMLFRDHRDHLLKDHASPENTDWLFA